MSQTPTCPRCGAPLPLDAPAGLCPKCLLQAGFESGAPSQSELPGTAASPPSSRFEPPAVEELAKRFPQLEILELLGKGGMGAVYKARQRGLDRLVAVKILPPEVGADPAFAERFMREARALAQLSHSNIVGVHDFGQTDGLYYFIMEYVDGLNLRQAILAGKMTPKEALLIVPQICDALQFAHDEGIVHRDIKPENILIDKRGRVKIADFGLAKLLGQEPADHRLTATHQVMGTLRYMAPEQLEGSHSVDHRADIYSLGVVFYELLTGELPMGRFAPPSKKVQIDVRLDEVVLRALEKEPEHRYQHASELRTSVDQISGTSAGAVVGAPPGRKTDLPPTAPDARLSRCALAGAIWAPFVLGLLVVVALYFTARTSVATLQPTRSEPIQGLTWAQVLIACMAVPFSLIGLAAPFGTTILGVVAIGQIRRSAGKLYGLPLAVFDALVFPLLLLDFLIVTFISAVIIFTLAAFGLLATMSPAISDGPLALLLGLPLAAWVDYRIVQAAWWKATGHEPPPKPSVAANVPPGALQSAATGVEAQRDGVKPRLTGAFIAKATLLAALAWLLVPILWNAREAGLLIAALGLSGVLTYIARQAEQFLPATAERWRQRTSAQRWGHLVFGVVFSAGAVYFLFVGGYQIWDRMNWNYMARTQDEFRQDYQGAEHRLLQPLKEFKDDVPRADLTPDDFRSTSGWTFSLIAPPSAGMFGSFGICASLFVGILMFAGAYHALLSDRYDQGTGWGVYSWPALQLTMVTVLPTTFYAFILLLILPTLNRTQYGSAGTAVDTEQDIPSVLAHVDAWAAAQKFDSGDQHSWILSKVPQRGTLARVAIRHLWRPNVFDRWHMTWVGLQRAAPDIALRIVGDASGKETLVTATARVRGGDDRDAKASRAQFESLRVALEDKKPQAEARPFEPIAIEAPVIAAAAAGVSPQEARFYALGNLSREAFDRGDSADAVKLAEEYLTLASKFPKDWNYGNAIHDANELLGLVALEYGDVAKAKTYLLAAGKSSGSPQLDSFGPNLELAAALLARGEKQTVLEYLTEVGKFWTMGKERLARFKKTIEAGETPRELKPAAADLSPLVGSWLAEDPLDPKGLLNMLLEFSADGSAVQSMLTRTTSKYRVVDGALRLVNPDSGKEEDPAPLEFHEGKLVMNFGKESPFPEREIKLTRGAADEKAGILAGTWSGKVHLEDVGDAELSCTFDSNQAGTMTQIMRMPADLRFTYAWKGGKLKYTLNGRPLEAKCQVSKDEFTLTGFQSHTDGKPHVFRRWNPPGTSSQIKPAVTAPK